MSHERYRTRAMTAADRRYGQIFGLLGYETRDQRAIQTEEDRTELKALRDVYQSRMGKKPFMGWDAATLRQKLNELEE